MPGGRLADVILGLDGDPTPRTSTRTLAWLDPEERRGQVVELLVDHHGTKARLELDVP